MIAAPSNPIGVFHPGTQHSWQTARALYDLNRLGWYATSIFHVPERLPYSLVPYLPSSIRRRVLSELRRYYHPDLNPKFVHTTNGEWLMRVAARVGLRRIASHLHQRGNSTIARPVGRLIRQHPVGTVWGYDLSSLEVFRCARSLGITTILDRTIGHPTVYNDLMAEVYDQYPEFFNSPFYRIKQQIIDRADEEHEIADKILVGSEYCASTLSNRRTESVDSGKVRILQYCFDGTFFKTMNRRVRTRNEPLRFIFTGQASPRKGIHLLLKAMQKIPKSAASLMIVGELQVPYKTFAKYSDRVEFFPTAPRPDVERFMSQADCLVFPSYFEGAGLVLYEAMITGLGIIQSKNADVVLPNESDLLMKEVTEDELYRCLMAAIDNRDLLEEQREKFALQTDRFSYEAYRGRIGDLIRDV
jgi:glycosyltransferase involved in cell wall biosynthesis